MTASPELQPPKADVGVDREHTEVEALGIVERACDILAKLALVAMMVIIGGEVVLRSLFQYSWQGTDEVASYLVVAITFLSLATCQAHRGFHELEIVKARLSPRGRALLEATLHLICLIAAFVLLWQFSRLVLNSWKSGDVSVAGLAIPYWIPQLTMPLGIAVFCIALVKAMFRSLKLFRTASPGMTSTAASRERE